VRAVAVALLLLVGACDEWGDFDIVTTTLRDGRVGQAYADTIRTEGGHGTVTIHLVSGNLPPGVSLRQAGRNAVLNGTPTYADTFLFTVEARDSTDSSDVADVVAKGLALVVLPP
jgi:hypothetical protein